LWRENLGFFLIFELFYGLQFLCVEFFFRGYMLSALTGKFGAYGIPLMVIPYCMIHYHKPMPEALAAVVAGVALGVLAWRTRSIWMGVLVHISVAYSMDFASIVQNVLRSAR
jgi:membrane protease YdiL (CAAX protease family)